MSINEMAVMNVIILMLELWIFHYHFRELYLHFFGGFVFAGLLVLVLKHIRLETMIFVYWKPHGTLTVIPIWESFLLTQFLGKLFIIIFFF